MRRSTNGSYAEAKAELYWLAIGGGRGLGQSLRWRARLAICAKRSGSRSVLAARWLAGASDYVFDLCDTPEKYHDPSASDTTSPRGSPEEKRESSSLVAIKRSSSEPLQTT
jgi:hypothetical protein